MINHENPLLNRPVVSNEIVSDKTETSEFLEQLKDRGECRGEVKTEK